MVILPPRSVRPGRPVERRRPSIGGGAQSRDGVWCSGARAGRCRFERLRIEAVLVLRRQAARWDAICRPVIRLWPALSWTYPGAIPAGYRGTIRSAVASLRRSRCCPSLIVSGAKRAVRRGCSTAGFGKSDIGGRSRRFRSRFRLPGLPPPNAPCGAGTQQSGGGRGARRERLFQA